jgi:hypothetical protein
MTTLRSRPQRHDLMGRNFAALTPTEGVVDFHSWV